MTSFYAKSSDAPLNVLFVVYPNIVLLDLVGPLQVFTHSRKSPKHGPAYATHIVSAKGGAISTNTVLEIESDAIGKWAGAPLHTIVIVGGDGAAAAAANRALVDDVKRLAARAKRICSVCSGALVLAATGLLDGRRAVTHWEDCGQLAAEYPEVNVEVDPIYVQDGDVWTSAGITAGIDMALAIVTEDLGKPAAIEMARSLVTPMVRSGGQSQFSAELDQQARDIDGKFADLHSWIAANLSQTITVDDMARECGMSPRNFSRRYTELMAQSPAKAVEAMRVDRARDLLATSDQGIQTVARTCGFQDDERMRRAFMRVVNTSPSEYRKQFQ